MAQSNPAHGVLDGPSTLVVAPSMGRRSGHTHRAHAWISTVEDIAAVVVGMPAKAATKRLEPRGYVVNVVVDEDRRESQAQGTNAECVNLTEGERPRAPTSPRLTPASPPPEDRARGDR